MKDGAKNFCLCVHVFFKYVNYKKTMNKFVSILFFLSTVLVTASFFTSCKSSKSTKQVKDVAFETLTQDDFGGSLKGGQFVITSEAEAKALDAKKWPKALEEVNFETHLLLAVAYGEKPTGGFTCQIERIAQHGKTLKVYYREAAPSKGAIVAQAFTYPWHVVKIPQLTGDIEFVRLENE